MKKLFLFLLVSVFAFCGCSDDDDEKTYVLSLPTYDSGTLYLGDTENPNESWDDEYNNKYAKNLLTDKTGIFEFDCLSACYYPGTTFSFGSDSFAFTNCTTGNYSAVTKKGVTNNTYVVVGASGYTEVAIRFKDSNNSKEKEDYRVKGLYVTNSYYAYSSMKDGAGFFGKDEIFGENDSFKLTIYNLNKTQKVECYLAEGTNFLTAWKWVDLTSLGETEGLKFELTTTKTNESGPMTPSYFCLDGITLED